MKSFKELLKSDLEIFFNLDEFAETHRVEGKEIPCILTTDSVGSTSLTADKDLQAVGLTSSSVTLYLKKSDGFFKHSAGKILNVDGKEMKILKVAEETDVLILNLSQYRGY